MVISIRLLTKMRGSSTFSKLIQLILKMEKVIYLTQRYFQFLQENYLFPLQRDLTDSTITRNIGV